MAVELYVWLSRVADDGAKCAFRLRGAEFLGWILEVEKGRVLLSWAPSPFFAQAAGTDQMSPVDEWVSLDEIAVDSYAAWDEASRRWIER